MPGTPNVLLRLSKHADYQRVYASSRKQFSQQMSFFASPRPQDRRSLTSGPRIGVTVGKVLGKAVDRNRIKRRMRECLRHHAYLLAGAPIDVVLHPRKSVLKLEFNVLDREVEAVFRKIARTLAAPARSPGAQP